MAALGEILPLILFFVAYKTMGMLVATGVAIVGVLIQVAMRFAQKRKVEPMLWVTLGVVVVFGGATLISGDEAYIKWKPTLVYWLAAVGLLVARFGFKKDLVRKGFESQFAPPESTWLRLLVAWVIFLLLLGGLNLFVAATYSSDVWVNFKLFGTMGLMFVFIAAQLAALWSYRREQ